ncbi:hypothetical protein BV372_17395 [Nostoc sp. T09]|uniref:KGK domain-containing protein n=1 Tax=Nostoc sp. T09 TaxID=1932621 RepID=UPI000A3BDA5D|nr:KGK domain-containing protein [Nostoc sp. T09]OUL33121.1 hypothetical protein BV372_17395 [Nostoc sp. T09]
MSDKIYLDDEDVVSLTEPDFGLGNTFKISELKLQIQAFFRETTEDGFFAAGRCIWFNKDGGAECEILRQEGGGWQKGIVLFRVEFIPDHPE